MTTHRSLNKLEFKAHMSIHNFVEVPEIELHESKAFTRDRLGKVHLLHDEDGESRIGNPRNTVISSLLLALLVIFSSSTAWAKGPNTQVTSQDPEVRSVSNWMNEGDPKPVFYQDGSTAVGFNEDGDPSLSTRF